MKEILLGGHRNKEEIINSTKNALIESLNEFKNFTREEIFEQRRQKFLSIGKQVPFSVFPQDIEWINKKNLFSSAKDIFSKFKKELIIFSLLTLFIILFLNYKL